MPDPAIAGNAARSSTAIVCRLGGRLRERSTAMTLDVHYAPADFRDRFAFGLVKTLRFVADRFFAKRYGHRAVVLETVAAVPGMVGGVLQHLKCLRRMSDDRGWIRELLDEAENERMHLMTFIEIARPTAFERLLVLLTQGVFFNAFFVLYLLSPKTAHRMVGYFEEEATWSYSCYLAEIDAGRIEDVPAPRRAIDYWKLPAGARLRDVVLAVRADEMGHRDRNHAFADELDGRPAAGTLGHTGIA
ncbi:MAG TPA: alternative oxidase [Azospirillaceae bacterium]|nr:alternative oxidase [Azospirillaceae bacterium]